jgi:hypothetical protein
MGALGLLALVLIQVTGDTACPAPAAVAAELERLSTSPDQELGRQGPGVSPEGPPAPGARRAVARLQRTGDGPLVIELADEAGAVLTRRELRFESSGCGELASAAALVLVVWERELRSGIVLPLALQRAAEEAAVRGGAGAGAAGTGARVAVELAGSFVGSLASSDFAAGGRLELRLGRRARAGLDVFGSVGFQGTGKRNEHLKIAANTNAMASWTRLAGTVAAGYRLGLPRRLWLEGQATLLLAGLLTEAMNVSNPGHARAFDPGLAAELRLGATLGAWRPFLGVSFVGWPQPQQLDVDGARVGQVPTWELLLVGGVAVGLN